MVNGAEGNKEQSQVLRSKVNKGYGNSWSMEKMHNGIVARQKRGHCVHSDPLSVTHDAISYAESDFGCILMFMSLNSIFAKKETK